MGIKNKITDDCNYFLTLTVMNWIDVFTKPVYKYIIIDALKYCQENKGLLLYAYCLMTNHLHLIAGAKEGYHLSDILRDFKKFTSKELTGAIKDNPNESRKKWLLNQFEYAGIYNNKIKNYKFWQEGNEAKELHSNSFIDQKLNYLHDNPVRAEIVDQPEDYKFSSARDYAGQKGLLDIALLE